MAAQGVASGWPPLTLRREGGAGPALVNQRNSCCRRIGIAKAKANAIGKIRALNKAPLWFVCVGTCTAQPSVRPGLTSGAGRGARDYSPRVARGLRVPVPVAIFKHSQF